MNRVELEDILDKVYTLAKEFNTKLELGSNLIQTSVQKELKTRRIKKEIQEEYLNIGILVHELYKLDRNLDLNIFKEKFEDIERKLDLVGSISAKQNSDEEMGEVDEGEIEFTYCKKCGKRNSIYVAYCNKCGEEL